MKTSKELLNGDYFRPSVEHCPSCVCDRCKKGKETFLLESDIAFIQSDARLDLEQENQQLRQDLALLQRKARALDWLTKQPTLAIWSGTFSDSDYNTSLGRVGAPICTISTMDSDGAESNSDEIGVGDSLLSAIERAIEKEKSE